MLLPARRCGHSRRHAQSAAQNDLPTAVPETTQGLMILHELLESAWITLLLATITTLILLLIGTPIAWWLAHTSWRIRPLIEALIAMPLVLPPTVLGFYLLIAFDPNLPIGSLFRTLTGDTLAFSFEGLVLASIIYSLPFVVQPLQAAIAAVPPAILEAAETLGAPGMDRFRTIVLPLCRSSFVTAAVLGFAHTVGEFGVVLMIGGNIPGETRVLSIALFDEVEALNLTGAHLIAAALVTFSLVTLTLVYVLNKGPSLGPRMDSGERPSG